MRNSISCSVAMLALSLPLPVLHAQASRGVLTPGSFAITDVSVFP